MTTSLRLPPSERDFEVYEAIAMRGLSTRLVAADHEISQTRVRQIVRRVLDWIAETLPEKPEADEKRELRLAQHIAADRFQAAYGETMQQWRQRHEPKFMGQLIRITFSAARLGVVAGTIEGLIADAIEGPLPMDETSPTRERGLDATHIEPVCAVNSAHSETHAGQNKTFPPTSFSLHPSSVAPPPPGDCSPDPSAEPPGTNHLQQHIAATAERDCHCDRNIAPVTRPNSRESVASQPLLTASPSLPVTKIRVAPDAPAEVTLEAIRQRREHHQARTARRTAR